MRFLALPLVLFAIMNVARADTVFRVGVTTRDFIPAEPYDWRGASTHALRVIIWYPAAADAREEPQWIGPRIVPFFSAGSAARDAPLGARPRRPLILLSHGDGDTASSLAWLGTALAAHGFVAVAVNHPGNNALEDYTVEGFSLWWLRAVDLSAVVDAMLAKAIPRAALMLFQHAAISYLFIFVGTCTLAGSMIFRAQCADPEGSDRDAVHAETARLAVDFFTANLR
jgi:predicted dienelactone hydrolase